jgi:hypothetical protein
VVDCLRQLLRRVPLPADGLAGFQQARLNENRCGVLDAFGLPSYQHLKKKTRQDDYQKFHTQPCLLSVPGGNYSKTIFCLFFFLSAAETMGCFAS